MSAIGPGDFVECVDASPHRHHPALTAKLALGAVYRVRAAVNYSGHQALLLAEIINPIAQTGREYAYLLRRFRPIYRPRADFLESLLKGVKTPQPEGADA